MSTPDAAIETLIAELRRTLWLGQLQRATRAALWAWAVIMTFGAILHALIGRPVASTTLAVGAASWLVALTATAMRRPTTGAAALYADRRLGGQSALATWLETDAQDSHRPPTPARTRLTEWVTAAVPAIRDAMRRQRSSWRLVRPAAAAITCTALAAAVMMLGGTQPAPTSGHDATSGPRPAATESPQLDETALAEAIATQLATSRISADATARRDERGQSRGGSGAASTAGDDSNIDAPDDAGAALRRESSGASGVPGTDREAGDTRDDSAPGASSRAAAGALLVQRRDLSGSTDASQRLANDERVASYDDEQASFGGAASGVGGRAAAARAPAARRESQLSPTEIAYVADWQSGSRAAIQEQR